MPWPGHVTGFRLLLLVTVLCAPPAASSAPEPPLFANHDVLELTLSVDFNGTSPKFQYGYLLTYREGVGDTPNCH